MNKLFSSVKRSFRNEPIVNATAVILVGIAATMGALSVASFFEMRKFNEKMFEEMQNRH